MSPVIIEPPVSVTAVVARIAKRAATPRSIVAPVLAAAEADFPFADPGTPETTTTMFACVQNTCTPLSTYNNNYVCTRNIVLACVTVSPHEALCTRILCSTLQHTATHCNTLQQHTATRCNTLQKKIFFKNKITVFSPTEKSVFSPTEIEM